MYSQKDPKYKNVKLGTGSLTIGQAGCFITSICNLLIQKDIIKLTPEDLNKICIKKGFYSNGNMLNAPKLAEYFKLNYEKRKYYSGTCIIETNHFKKLGVPQHFFVSKGNKRLDPLDYPCEWEKNDYNPISYRVFTKKEPMQKVSEPTQGFESQVDGTITTTLNPIPTSDSTTSQITPPEPISSPTIDFKQTDGLMLTLKTLWDRILDIITNYLTKLWKN